MRKRPVDALFTRTRQGLLAATLLHPDRRWSMSDLAKHIGCTVSTLQRELTALTEAGVLMRLHEGNRVYFSANPACPFLRELQGLMIKTSAVVDRIQDVLRPHRAKIFAAFIYGSFARAEQVAESDVDVLVVGDSGLAALAPGIRRAEASIGRAVNVTVYSPAEFDQRVREDNHFVRELLRGPKLMLLGDVDALRGSRA